MKVLPIASPPVSTPLPDVERVESFEQMGLKEELLRGVYAHGMIMLFGLLILWILILILWILILILWILILIFLI